MRVLLTRPEADSRRSAAKLEALGHTAVIAPLFEIASTGAPIPHDLGDRLLATSSHAFAHLPADAAIRAARIDVVGERTADAARMSGFTQIATVAPDAKSLAISIARERAPAQAFLYLAGRERRPDLELALAALGHEVTPWVVYETREAEGAGARIGQIWREARIDAALHFSARSAALYKALADAAGLTREAMAPIQIAISARAAQELAGAGDLRIAQTPDLEGLLACL